MKAPVLGMHGMRSGGGEGDGAVGRGTVPWALGTLQALEERAAKAGSRLPLSWTTSQGCGCSEQPGSRRSNLPLDQEQAWSPEAVALPSSVFLSCDTHLLPRKHTPGHLYVSP